MNRRKLSFLLLLILVIGLCTFLLWPAPEPEEIQYSNEDMPADNSVMQDEENTESVIAENFEKGINGTYAHYFKKENATVFVYFDEEHDIYLQEIVEMENGVPIKSAGKYSLHESEGILKIDGVEKSFERDGENLVIDGVLYERTQGILLTP